MRIILIGAYGDIGQAALAELSQRHEVVRAGRTRGDILVDMADIASVQAMYDQAGTVDAVVCTAGEVHFGPLKDMTPDQMALGLQNKLMGQINLVMAGFDRIAPNGSFTLTSGVLDRDPIPLGTGAATANGALAGFVKGAAIEMPHSQRINVVSPGMLEVSAPRYGDWFRGHIPVSSAHVGLAYAKAVEGAGTGQVIIVA